MIPIKIDNSNLSLLNLHLEKTESSIRTKLISKKNSFVPHTFEYTVFDWLEWHLPLILKSQPAKLRTLINSFNNFLDTKMVNMPWNSKDYEIATTKELQQICRENQIRNFSKKSKTELINLINTNSLNNYDTVNKIKFKKFKHHIEEVFTSFYEKAWDNILNYSRYHFVEKHKINTCPYCNRGYIFIAKTDTKTGSLRPEIDHFFPKSIYPYLAMSFYNLIPSCSVCNHTKKDRDPFKDNLLSPYEIDYDTSKFTYKLNNLDFYQIKTKKYTTNLESFDIQLHNKNIETIDKYFKLSTLYEQHKDIVIELLIKKTEYPKSYIEELKSNFQFTDDEIYRFLLCNYQKDKDLHKRPLSKLTQDIANELKLI